MEGKSHSVRSISSKITLISESIVSCVLGFIQDAAQSALMAGTDLTIDMYNCTKEDKNYF